MERFPISIFTDETTEAIKMREEREKDCCVLYLICSGRAIVSHRKRALESIIRAISKGTLSNNKQVEAIRNNLKREDGGWRYLRPIEYIKFDFIIDEFGDFDD